MKKITSLALLLLSYTGVTVAQFLDSSFNSVGYNINTNGGLVENMVFQPDGKIVCAVDYYSSCTCDWNLYTARYLSNGVIDSGFGINGKAKIYTSGYDNWCKSIALQSDGKIVAGGYGVYTSVLCPPPNNLVVARFTASGQPDVTFGTNGLVNAFGIFPYSQLYGSEVYRVHVTSSGKILISGNCKVGSVSNGCRRGFVARLNTNGTLDNTFGSGGYMLLNNPGNIYLSQYGDMTLDALGNIYVTELDVTPTWGMATRIYKLSSSGLLESSFGNGGAITCNFAPYYGYPTRGKFRNDGKFVLSGKLTDSTNHGSTAFVALIDPDGSQSSSYVTGMRIFYFPGYNSIMNDVKILPDNKVIYTGYYASSMANCFPFVGCLNADGSYDLTFANGDSLVAYTNLGYGTVPYCLQYQSDNKVVIAGFNSPGYMFLLRMLPYWALPTSILQTEKDLGVSDAVYPNPFQQEINFSFSINKNHTVHLLNTIGEVLFEANGSSEGLRIDASHLPKGIYFARVTDEKNNSVTKKIVKM